MLRLKALDAWGIKAEKNMTMDSDFISF